MASEKKYSVGYIIKSTLANIGRFIAILFMVGIITGCIVASVLTVYVLRYINSDDPVSLDNFEMKYTTIIYAPEHDTGEYYELQRLQTQENRIFVSYDKIPKHMVNALIAVEDKRFWSHHGVDWQRTAGAFLNLFFSIYDSQHGGSTITQQLVKNITGEDEVRIERKVQEIFRALNLEKNYSKEQILEAYLNTVYYSNNCYGVQAAANTYFGKDVSELSLAESAAIIGITKAPGAYDPFVHPENNKQRQEHILGEMLDQGLITQKEHDGAVAEKLNFQKDIAYERIYPVYSYFVDYVIECVIRDLRDKYGYSAEYAQQMVNSGGLRIYSTVDERVQDIVTKYYSSSENFPPLYNPEYPQSACVVTDTNGKIVALAGAIGEKSAMREFSRATGAVRQPGSAIKPLAAYLQAFENDIVTWSTKIDDHPITIKNGNTTMSWPVNFQRNYIGPITIDMAIQQSRNTIPVKLVQMVSERRVFNFLHDKLNFKTLVGEGEPNDLNLSSMALGGMTYGVTPLDMAGGYQIYANGGYFTPPYAYTQVFDANGDLILESDTTPRRVISPETATIVNRLLQRVTHGGPGATGTAAPFSTMAMGGKTGTSTDDNDQWFVGITPYYVTSIWMGYDTNQTIRYIQYAPPIVYKQIMGPVHEGLEIKEFPVWGNVVQRNYCADSGNLASPNCPNVGTGWYKQTNLPPECDHASLAETVDLDDEDTDDTDREDETSSSSSGSGVRLPSSNKNSSSSRRVIDNDD